MLYQCTQSNIITQESTVNLAVWLFCKNLISFHVCTGTNPNFMYNLLRLSSISIKNVTLFHGPQHQTERRMQSSINTVWKVSLVHQNHFSVPWSHLFPFTYSYLFQASYSLILAKHGKLWLPLTVINDPMQIYIYNLMVYIYVAVVTIFYTSKCDEDWTNNNFPSCAYLCYCSLYRV